MLGIDLDDSLKLIAVFAQILSVESLYVQTLPS